MYCTLRMYLHIVGTFRLPQWFDARALCPPFPPCYALAYMFWKPSRSCICGWVLLKMGEFCWRMKMACFMKTKADVVLQMRARHKIAWPNASYSLSLLWYVWLLIRGTKVLHFVRMRSFSRKSAGVGSRSPGFLAFSQFFRIFQTFLVWTGFPMTIDCYSYCSRGPYNSLMSLHQLQVVQTSLHTWSTSQSRWWCDMWWWKASKRNAWSAR